MIRCSKCLKPDTLPGVEFVDGICPACIRYENRKNIDWKSRQELLAKICDGHRKNDGTYDCIIPVSGGKDSYCQVNLFKNVYKMNPLLLTVTDPFTHTKEGTHNFNNISKVFGCDHITLNINPEFVLKSSIATFERLGSTNWVVDKAIYAWPLQIAIQMGIRLVVYGENVAWEYGGKNAEDTYDANKQIWNDVVKAEGEDVIKELDPDGRYSNALHYPTPEALKASGMQAIYTSYFYPWNDLENVKVAESFGFRKLTSMTRDGFLDDYAQIDSVGYLFNYYLKFMKYGIGRVVDIGSRWVRYGHITKDGGTMLERNLMDHLVNEGRFDQNIANDFMNKTGVSEEWFFKTLSKWWNRDIFDITPKGWSWKK